jgi:DNA-directed RNA polymerase sigma subunit (sigma70/sigma32)
MEDLSSREAQIIEMRFGLADGNPMTLEEIGKHFRVTRERIRQVSGNAISVMWRDFSRTFSRPSVLLSSSSLLCSYRLFS